MSRLSGDILTSIRASACGGNFIASMENRIYHFKGTPKEIGTSMGQALGKRLEQNISLYLAKRPPLEGTLDMFKLRSEALPWMRRLPERFQAELEGMAVGANLPLQRLAEWAYLDECIQEECSGFICSLNGKVWVGRNNDFYVPELWGYMTIREVERRIPTVSFGMQGDVFTPTGINHEKLWLHYNYLPMFDTPGSDRPRLPCYVLLTEMLETCSRIEDVETLLRRFDRNSGMMLFVVDGKTDEYAIFECSCRQYFKRIPAGNWLVGTNHYITCQVGENNRRSEFVYSHLEELLHALYLRQDNVSIPADLIAILADGKVEAHEENYGTVNANIACPGIMQVWHTFGGFPAASQGNWQQIAWPWKEE
jgi:hypothetical protein